MKHIYDLTRFKLQHDGMEYDFTIHDLSSVEPFNAPFVILTACNPNNTPLSATENAIRNKELFSELMGTPLPF